MAEPKVMLFEEGRDQGIRCRLIIDWYKIDSYIYPNKEGLLLAIKKNKPDIVFIDLNLYARIDGIKTAQIIRFRYGVPVLYVW